MKRTWFKLVSAGKTRGNKKAFKFNLEMLGGLSMREPWDILHGREKI
jgi:hypothetical protein